MALRGGSFLTAKQPVFSCDGKFLLVCTGCTVSVLSVATGLRVGELQGHTDRVSSIVVVHGPEEAKSALTHAWTCSLDGTVRHWNFISGMQIKSITIGRRIVSMVIPAVCKPSSDKANTQLLAFLSVDLEKNEEQPDEQKDGSEQVKVRVAKESKFRGRVIIYNLGKKKQIDGNLAMAISPRNLVVSPRGSLIGMVDSRKIWIWKLPSEPLKYAKQVQCTLLHPWESLTAMAFDPTETSVAAGDQRGQIVLWKNVGERTFCENDSLNKTTDDAESRTTYHWHSQEVTCLSFTSDGAYLLSGGLEAVLVLWQLETGTQNFLPRLAAPLCCISNSPDPAVFAISLADNCLKFLNIGSMKMDRVIQGIQPVVPCPDKTAWSNVTKVALHRDGKVVLPSVNMTLQFYDIFRDQHAHQIQVSPRNFVSTFDESKDAFGQSAVVTHVAFSADTSVMATVDLRLAENSSDASAPALRAAKTSAGGGSSLKFWMKAAGKVPYILHTCVDSPHSAEILALTYHPSDHVVVTCSRASDFKIWSQTKRNEKTYWKCSSAGSYERKFLHSAAFSADGTLLAVAADEYVTLWNPSSNRLLCVLNHPGTNHEIVGSLSFVPKSPYLVSTSYGKRPHLAVWNLSTLSVWWSYQIEVQGIAVDPDSSHFAVLANDSNHTRVCLFKPENPVPVAVWNFKDGIGGALQFLPSSFVPEEDKIESNTSTSKLLVLNKYREYLIFDPYSVTDSKPEHKIHAKAASLDALSAYEAMYGALQTSTKLEATRDGHQEVAKVQARRPWGNLLNAPSHVLPPLTKVGAQILESFLQKRIQT